LCNLKGPRSGRKLDEFIGDHERVKYIMRGQVDYKENVYVSQNNIKLRVLKKIRVKGKQNS
jgi:hypothetical protein